MPELIRKARKHVPQRNCRSEPSLPTCPCSHLSGLAVTAHSEYQLASYLSSRLSTSSSNSSSTLSQLIPTLVKVVEEETVHAEDALQGQVCLAWLHRTAHEPDLALSRLPEDIVRQWGHLAGVVAHPIEWTRICLLKAVYIKGTSSLLIWFSYTKPDLSRCMLRREGEYG